MSIKETEAIVLHSRKQGETSKILTMLTHSFGKMSLMAKGSRNVKSKYLGVLETFNYISIIFYYKESRSLQFTSQAEIIDSFPGIHAELGKMALAAVPLEIIEKTEPREHKNPQLFQLLLDTLRAFETCTSGLKNITRSFQLKFLKISGIQPQLEKCNQCGNVKAEGMNHFDLDRGFYHCRACGGPFETSVELSCNALENLRWLNQAPVHSAGKANITAQTGKQIDHFLVSYFKYHFEGLKNIKSLKYLQDLTNHLQ